MEQQETTMNEAELRARIAAQEKTIQVLMDTVERQSAEGASSLELLSQNLSLERVVQRKTEALQKALRELQQTQAQLLQASKLESVGLLAAGIAHEINTPAQFIGTNIDFLDESFAGIQRLMAAVGEQLQVRNGGGDAQTGDKISGLMEEIDWPYLNEEIPLAIRQSKEGINRISAIVQAMKEFSHPSSKEMVKTNLNQLIATTVTVASNEWKYVAEVQTDLDPDLPQTACLATELGQVFLNILVNAVHAVASKVGGASMDKKGRIRISTRRDGDQVEIRISDSGTGIPEDIRDRVFDPFFTTKGVGKGTGQGLAISYDVVTQKHGGTLSFESQPGEGTTFIIRLPIDQDAAG
jgi:two-component system, NtrC family, sensor kinase